MNLLVPTGRSNGVPPVWTRSVGQIPLLRHSSSLSEQRRIVAKVDELLALVDRLESDLAESRAQQERLATTLIEPALQAT